MHGAKKKSKFSTGFLTRDSSGRRVMLTTHGAEVEK